LTFGIVSGTERSTNLDEWNKYVICPLQV